jgi:hypothetical protein
MIQPITLNLININLNHNLTFHVIFNIFNAICHNLKLEFVTNGKVRCDENEHKRVNA